MKFKIMKIFNFLDKNNIKYLLLHPLDTSKELNDVDLVINKLEFIRLLKLIECSDFSVMCKYTNYRESIKLYVDDITLDIQHYIAFLPYKGLIIRKEYPNSTVDLENDFVIYPVINDEVLFTFWLYRLLLCKGKLSNEIIPDIFKNKFYNNWETLLRSSFFKEWSGYICGSKNYDHILNLLALFPKQTFLDESLDYNQIFIDLVFKKHRFLNIVYFLFKIKYKVFRRIGCYKNFVEIDKILKTY